MDLNPLDIWSFIDLKPDSNLLFVSVKPLVICWFIVVNNSLACEKPLDICSVMKDIWYPGQSMFGPSYSSGMNNWLVAVVVIAIIIISMQQQVANASHHHHTSLQKCTPPLRLYSTHSERMRFVNA